MVEENEILRFNGRLSAAGYAAVLVSGFLRTALHAFQNHTTTLLFILSRINDKDASDVPF